MIQRYEEIIEADGDVIVREHKYGRYVLFTDHEAEVKRLRGALRRFLAAYKPCTHETVHRGGAIWTICEDCGKQWADDEGGFKPYVEPEWISEARKLVRQ